jgi:hypothetical protein
LEALVKSSRIFEELEFTQGSACYLLEQEKFKVLEKFIGFTGPHIKKLIIGLIEVDPLIFQKLLNLLPNLESLDLDMVENTSLEKTINWDLKSTRIKRIKMIKCIGPDNMLASLEKCAIRELELELKYWSDAKQEVLLKFLKAQEKNLKKLIVGSCDLSILIDFKDLRLEHLDYGYRYGANNPSLEFLKCQEDLKFLRLFMANYSIENFNLVFGLTNLEVLELWGPLRDRSVFILNKLYKLGKLKSLRVDQYVSRNILDHLKFGVFNELRELDAFLKGLL